MAKVKRLIHRVDLEIYKRSVYFFFNHDFKKVLEWVDKEYPTTYGTEDDDPHRLRDGCTIICPVYCDIVIWMPVIPKTSSDFCTLQHEISHACIAIMERLHIDITDKNSEAYCYLNGYITKQIYDKLWSF